MKQIKNQDELITILAQRSRFTKGDIKIIFDELTNLMEEMVFTDDGVFPEGNKPKALMKIRDFGQLLVQRIPERKGNKGETLEPTTRVFFRLSERIRFAGRGEKPEDLGLDSEDEM
jgi:hypothetical protein